jgi:hypothetical protein
MVKTSQNTITSLLALVLLIFSDISHAIIIFDEAVSGDLDTFDTRTFVLTDGYYRVLGSSSNTSSGFDLDGFRILVPGDFKRGRRLLDFHFIYYNVNVSTNTTRLTTGMIWSAGDYFETVVRDIPWFPEAHRINLLGSHDPDYWAGVNTGGVGSGLSSYYVDTYLMSRIGDGGSWNWEMRFWVAPEPSTFALFSIGFLGVGAARKLKKH